ncbi:MAG: hypothetical protein RBT16_03125 [Desulfococcus multivorans]|jgi:hypothetical protein|nr:hypothetical protein [Desulfococcus multivorans]
MLSDNKKRSTVMTTQPSTNAGSDPVALLVVHGIGSQEPGETLRGLLGGLRLAFGDRLAIRQAAGDHAILSGIGRPVHVFEVYWADLLGGEIVKRSFDFDRIFEVVWFPLLNHSSGRLSTEICSRWRVLWWTAMLAPLSSLLCAGFWGAKFLASIPTGFLKALQESKARPSARTKTVGFLETFRTKHKDPDRGRTILDDLMDQVVGDVFNYVQGVARAFPGESERNRELIRHVDEIHVRFLRTAERAEKQGCREIQVLAHSLGTVIAFLAMCPEVRPARSTIGPAQLSRFYTIGSPLEKIRFFWTRLVEHSRNGPAIAVVDRLIAADSTHGGKSAMKWENFFSRLDLVSGPLQKLPGWPTPTNHPARGLGGLIRAHVAYNSNPVFLSLLAEGLTGKPSQIRLSLFRRLVHSLMAALESLILPAVFLALALMGLAFMGGIAWLTGWVVSQPLEWLDLGGWAQGVRIYFVAAILFVMIVVQVWLGRGRAEELYTRFWAPDKTE